MRLPYIAFMSEDELDLGHAGESFFWNMKNLPQARLTEHTQRIEAFERRGALRPTARNDAIPDLDLDDLGSD